jgi:hypothetical protein
MPVLHDEDSLSMKDSQSEQSEKIKRFEITVNHANRVHVP